MKALLLLLCLVSVAQANEKEEFRGILRDFIQQVPTYKEVDFQTPY